ncbi:hypothetical protein BGI32_01895 [Snodgrassella alvi]|uniref:Uncharacterized protein n=1 Tax=Snodgrassella alvi TaxID=1196083 RepID=A0A2N9WW23_9NEIS|nr:hypothetical protein BGI32_01895 [Snodgrassella alvi]
MNIQVVATPITIIVPARTCIPTDFLSNIIAIIINLKTVFIARKIPLTLTEAFSSPLFRQHQAVTRVQSIFS